MKKCIFGLLPLVILLHSCGPVNRLTHLKRTPREYSMNYCGEPVIAPRNEYTKESWIVFSDRDNISYRNPGGKVKFKNVDFLQPFFVIKEKGDYLRLVKYDSEIIENDIFRSKIKDRKKAEYYGWMHKSRLLLTKQSVTDISTGFKNKDVSIITDSTSLSVPMIYFIQDSIRTFKDPNLDAENGKIPLNEIVYTLKHSQDREKTLISKKTIVSPDSVKSDVFGWVHSSLLQNIGQVLHVDFNSLPYDSLDFKDLHRENSLDLTKWQIEESAGISFQNPALKYSPVISYCKEDSGANFKTGIPLPVVDQRDNYVFNVNGNKIMYSRFKELEKELRKLNFIFIFEGQQQVFANYPSVVSAIQNLQPLFEDENDIFQYKFGAVWAYNNPNTSSQGPTVRSFSLTNNYTEIIDSLITMADKLKSYQPITVQNSWVGLRRAVDVIEPFSDETNIFVLIGETGLTERADSVLVRRIANANIRILGYQMHSLVDNPGNNFVLQVENMIHNSAAILSRNKREKIVYIDQLRQNNRYRESVKNVYTLDFPERSMTQGWVLFPEKNVDLPLDILTNSMDTLISEVKWDNNNLVNSLYKAFATVGNHLYKFDTLLVDYNQWDNSMRLMNRDIIKAFQKQLPAWYLPSSRFSVSDSIQEHLGYHLLLSSDELAKLVQFMNDISSNEVDYKYQGGENQKARIRCNCPDDDDYIPMPAIVDSNGNPKYMNTGSIRRKLQNIYLEELKMCKHCSRSSLKKISLADAQRSITGCPTFNQFLKIYTIGTLKSKKHLPDNMLDELVTYLKSKRDGLDRYLRNPDKFVSNGETYYWISKNLLP